MKNFSFLLISLITIFFMSNHTVLAQQWNGSTSINGTIQRNGIVGIGLTNPPSDTQLYTKSNLKVGILAEMHHTIDYQFGIVSAVDRNRTKAFSVLNKQGSTYNDTFVVFGDGNVRATEVRVKSPIFPDYVFENDYNLMSISEIEDYIKINKHLPNIPSAKNVQENGLALGNIQVKQMEKIEELFLYIIKLNKKIEDLENEVEILKDNK